MINIKETIKAIQNDKDYSMNTCKVDYVKENNKMFLIHFMPTDAEEHIGEQFYFTVSKTNGKYNELILPNDESFDILDEFENKEIIKY